MEIFAGLARNGFAHIEGDLAYRFIPDLLSEACFRLASQSTAPPGETAEAVGEAAAAAAQAAALYARLVVNEGRLLGWSVTDLCLGRLALARGDRAATGSHLRSALNFVRRSEAILYERPILDLLARTG